MNVGKILSKSLVATAIAATVVGSCVGYKNRKENCENQRAILSQNISNKDLNDISYRVEIGQTTWKKANDSLNADRAIKDSLLCKVGLPDKFVDSLAANVENHKQNWHQVCDSLNNLFNGGFKTFVKK